MARPNLQYLCSKVFMIILILADVSYDSNLVLKKLDGSYECVEYFSQLHATTLPRQNLQVHKNMRNFNAKKFKPRTSRCGDTRAANTISRVLLLPPFLSASAVVKAIVSITWPD